MKTLITILTLTLISTVSTAQTLAMHKNLKTVMATQLEQELQDSLIAYTGTGYICDVTYYPNSTSTLAGAHGYVVFTIYDEPLCEGSYLKQGFLFSKGAATDETIAIYGIVNASLYSELALLHLYDNLILASREGTRVYINGSKTGIQTYTVGFKGKE